MTFEIIKGDLFDPSLNFDAIAQGVNCQGIMGAGIAVVFRNRSPEMYEAYIDLCSEFSAVLPGLIHHYEEESHWVDDDETNTGYWTYAPDTYNLFTQIMPGANADYTLVQRSALLMRMHAEDRNYKRVGLPWIGCGIGGLEKHNVEHIFRRILEDSVTQFILVEQ